MYSAIWRLLPGPLWLRILLALTLVLAVIAVLFSWVFPWIDNSLNLVDVTVGGEE